MSWRCQYMWNGLPGEGQQVHGRAGEVEGAGHVAGMDEAVVFRGAVGQGGVGAAAEFPHSLAVGKGRVVDGILGAAGGVEHPPFRLFPPGGLLGMAGQEGHAGHQPQGRPAVLLRLGVVVDTGAGRHGAKTGQVVQRDVGQHGTLFLAHQVLDQGSGQSQVGDGDATLALPEEALAPLAPFGSRGFRPPPTFLGTHAVLGAGVVGEAEVAQTLARDLTQILGGDASGLGVEFGRRGGQGQGGDGLAGVLAIPEHAAEEVAAVGPAWPVVVVAQCHRNPTGDHGQVAPTHLCLGGRELHLTEVGQG